MSRKKTEIKKQTIVQKRLNDVDGDESSRGDDKSLENGTFAHVSE